jgi:hypothetical protein
MNISSGYEPARGCLLPFALIQSLALPDGVGKHIFGTGLTITVTTSPLVKRRGERGASNPDNCSNQLTNKCLDPYNICADALACGFFFVRSRVFPSARLAMPAPGCLEERHLISQPQKAAKYGGR